MLNTGWQVYKQARFLRLAGKFCIHEKYWWNHRVHTTETKNVPSKKVGHHDKVVDVSRCLFDGLTLASTLHVARDVTCY